MTFIADLTEQHWWHEITLAYCQTIPETFTAIMVGWLGDTVPSSGKVPGDAIRNLEWAYQHRTIDQGALGEHNCGICGNYFDRGEILIVDGSKLYVAPKMILHYIKDHSYFPPHEFLEALQKINININTQGK